MISLIIGHKGSGKTKHLIQMVNEAVESSKGNVRRKPSSLMMSTTVRGLLQRITSA